MTVLMLFIREPISASPSTAWYREAFTMHSSDVLFSSVNKTGILDANLVDFMSLINVDYIGSDGCFVLKNVWSYGDFCYSSYSSGCGDGSSGCSVNEVLEMV